MNPQHAIDLQLILNAARTCPSGDNCQPWTFQLNDSVLFANYDQVLGQHTMNVGNTASYLALGCLIETIHLAAAAQGFVPEIEHHSDLSIAVRFKKGFIENPLFSQLAGQIFRRATDRRSYLGGTLELEVFREIRADCEASEATCLGLSNVTDPEVMDYFALCEQLVWSDPLTTRDLLHWLRFSRQEAEISRDGMPWYSLGIQYLDSRILKIIRTVPKLRNIGVTAAAGLIGRQLIRRQLRSSAGVMLFATRGNRPENVIEVGRLAMRAWLRLTEKDYALQPLTAMSMFPYTVHNNLAPSFPMAQKFHIAFQSAPVLLRSTFQLPDDSMPIWGFRVGKSTPLPPDVRTLRRR